MRFGSQVWRICALCSVLVLGAFAGGEALAQDDDLPSRVPAEGLAVLDCDPPAPAPEDSCIVRVPSNQTLADLTSRSTGEQTANFRIVRSNDELPGDLNLSATLVLVDLSIGQDGGRRATWPLEQQQIIRLIENLPPGERIAVYGFGAQLQRLSDFSTTRQSAIAAVRDLELNERNTILSSNVTSAISVLRRQDNTLLRNLIVVSDGDEEGITDVEQITAAASAEGVTLSALGMFWRAEGNRLTTLGIDVLQRLTEPQNGLTQSVFLRNRDDVPAAVGAFLDRYTTSVGASGLILPSGEPAAAQISVEMNVPIEGGNGATEVQTYQVQFVPDAPETPEPEAEPEVEPEPEPATLLGLPPIYVYLGAALLGLLLLAVLFVVLRSRSSEERPTEPEEDDAFGAAVSEAPTEAEPVAPAPAKPASAYLVRMDTGERLAVRGNRIAIGRSSVNGVIVPDEGISRVHAELHRNRDGGFSVTDMDSLNGTFVNDKKVKGTVAVRIGDTLGFGKVKTKLVLP